MLRGSLPLLSASVPVVSLFTPSPRRVVASAASFAPPRSVSLFFVSDPVFSVTTLTLCAIPSTWSERSFTFLIGPAVLSFNVFAFSLSVFAFSSSAFTSSVYVFTVCTRPGFSVSSLERPLLNVSALLSRVSAFFTRSFKPSLTFSTPFCILVNPVLRFPAFSLRLSVPAERASQPFLSESAFVDIIFSPSLTELSSFERSVTVFVISVIPWATPPALSDTACRLSETLPRAVLMFSAEVLILFSFLFASSATSSAAFDAAVSAAVSILLFASSARPTNFSEAFSAAVSAACLAIPSLFSRSSGSIPRIAL